MLHDGMKKVLFTLKGKKMNCRTCKYWYSPKGFDSMGICRRFPQTQNKPPDDWCGEHTEPVVFIKKEKN